MGKLSDDQKSLLAGMIEADFKELSERVAYLERIVKQYLLDMEKGKVP